MYPLHRLLSASDQAYERARAEVFDTMPAGLPLDVAALSDYQRQLLLDVSRAEAALKEYRDSSLRQIRRDSTPALQGVHPAPD